MSGSHQFTASHGDQLSVVPERGGLLTSWICSGRERLYLDQERFADPSKSVRGGVPVLFPICGNLPNDTLQLPQGTFHLSQHGFARDLPWQLQPLAEGEGIRLRLEDSEATRAVFPFPFCLTLDYRLEPSVLAIAVTVEHRPYGEGVMPFSLGLHPYFAVSDLAAVSLEGLPERCLDHHQMAEASTASQLAQIDRGIDLLAAPTQRSVRLRDQGSSELIEMELQAPLDLAVVWSEPPRSMVCLEPWTAPRGALISGDRRLELKPGESCRLTCTYRVVQA
ncbi:MAG: galactose mutarotase [Vulcanococcus sp.]